jgi:BolA family transcriptional regulator, general stress-responsive regulator
MSVIDRMRTTLTTELAPIRLDIVDESGRHAHHAGARPEGETHFRVRIVSAAFEGKTRLERHRLVNALLAPEFAAGVHALALTAMTPAETLSATE